MKMLGSQHFVFLLFSSMTNIYHRTQKCCSWSALCWENLLFEVLNGKSFISSCAWYSTPNRISWYVLLGRYNIMPNSHCKHQRNTDLLRQYSLHSLVCWFVAWLAKMLFLLTIQCFLENPLPRQYRTMNW